MIEKGDTEEVDALVVPEPEPASQFPVRRSPAPVAQAAAAAAGGIVIGALLARLVGRRGRRAVAKTPARRLLARRGTERGLAEIVASRSLLVDVHLLGASSKGR